MFLTILMFLAGLAILTAGAELLVKGSSRLALRLGVPALIVGLTIVAFGTSAPEMVVSIKAALTGQADIAMGNVVGSNIFNILFILGASALVAPLVIHRQLVARETPIMIAVSMLAIALAWNGVISRMEGLLLFALFILYTAGHVWAGLKSNKAAVDPAKEPVPGRIFMDIFLIAGGLVALVWGARWLLDSSVAMAKAMGVSELVIGLTIVAAGTSLPEVATSILATFRGERDIAVGNVVGSNILNILGVLGLSSAVSPSGVAAAPQSVVFDIPVMIAVAVLCLPVFVSGQTMSRREGAAFLLMYLVYTACLISSSRAHVSAETFRMVSLYGLMPVAFIVTGYRALRNSAPPQVAAPVKEG